MECIICGKTNNNNTFWNLKNDNNISSFEKNIFSSWKRECITATCQVLFGSKSEYFVDYFQNAKYCSCCEQVVRDLGFTWKQMKSFQKQIFQLSRKINNLLDGNYNQIDEKSEADVVADRISTLSLVKNETPDFSNYSFKEMVEIIFTLISSPQNSANLHTHSFGSHAFSTTNWTQQVDAEFNTNTDKDFDTDYCLKNDLQDISPSEGNLLTRFKEENSIEEYDNSHIDYCDFDDNETEHSFSYSRSGDVTKNERDSATEKSSENITSFGTMESKDNSLKCPFENCNLYFDTEYNQQTHFYLTHGFIKPYICPGCPLKFIHEDDMMSHMKIAHDESLVYNRCCFCGTLYENKKRLAFHYSNTHQKTNPFKCGFCGEVFKNREYLINHTMKSHPRAIKEEINKQKCPHCERKISKRMLNQHVRFKHPSILNSCSFECNFCGKKYMKEEDLKLHNSTSHQDPNPFQCAFCSALYTNREDLMLHTSDIHSDEKHKFICNFCGENFTEEGSLTQHSSIDHSHKCSLCEMKFTALNMLISHTGQQHKQKPNFKCEECGKVFKTDWSCLRHRNDFHTNSGHKCHPCGIVLATKSELRDHKWSVHENPVDPSTENPEEGQSPNAFICGFCPKKFNNFVILRKHVKVYHQKQNNVGKFKCGLCGGSYATLHSLGEHLKFRCRPSLPCCKFCGKGYNSEEELNAHNSVAHQGPNPFSCAFCPEIFNNSSYLIRHTKLVHNNPESLVRKFKCDVCGVYRSSKSSLRRHSIIHLDPSLVIKCNLCRRLFSDNDKLENHMRVAHAQQFICDYCGRSYKERRRLNSHLKNHIEDRNVQCKVCDKKFKNAANCRQHERTHSDIKDFVCDICGKAFTHIGNMIEHRKIHTGEPKRSRKNMF